MPKTNIISYWIWFWGGMTVVVLMITQGTDWSMWGVIIAVVTLACVLGGVVISIRNWFINKRQLKNPFDVYYEQPKENVECVKQANTSKITQYLNITLKINANVYVEHISIEFKGNGEIPKIKRLYDWEYGVDTPIHPNIFIRPKDSTWFWEYHPPLRRFPKSRITIGIEYIAQNSFDGSIMFGFTAPGTSINKLLSFRVSDDER